MQIQRVVGGLTVLLLLTWVTWCVAPGVEWLNEKTGYEEEYCDFELTPVELGYPGDPQSTLYDVTLSYVFVDEVTGRVFTVRNKYDLLWLKHRLKLLRKNGDEESAKKVLDHYEKVAEEG